MHGDKEDKDKPPSKQEELRVEVVKMREEADFWRQSEKVSRQCLRALLKEKLFFGVEGTDEVPAQEQENEQVKECLDLLDQNEKLSAELSAMSNEGKLLRLIAARALRLPGRPAEERSEGAQGKEDSAAGKSKASSSLHSSTASAARGTSRRQEEVELEMWNTLKKSHDRMALLESTIESLQQRADEKNSSFSSSRALDASQRSFYPLLFTAAPPPAEDSELAARIRRLELIVQNLEKNPQQGLAHAPAQPAGLVNGSAKGEDTGLRTLASATKNKTADLVERILRVEERLSSR